MTEQNVIGTVKYNESGKALEIFDEKLELQEAPEASDIIWENMPLTQYQIFRNTLFFGIIVLAFLLLIVYLFIITHNILDVTNKRYPQMTSCDLYRQVHDT